MASREPCRHPGKREQLAAQRRRMVTHLAFEELEQRQLLSGTHLVFAQQPGDGQAGTALGPAITVLVEDGSNHVLATNTSLVTLAVLNNSGGATLSGTASANAVGGVAKFSSLSLDKVGQGYTLVATAPGASGAISGGFAIQSAAATHFDVTSAVSSTVAGTMFTVTVTALDQFQNIASGYTGTVHFTSTDAQGVLPKDYAFTAADAGVHTFSVALDSAGTQSITVIDPAKLTGSQGGIVVMPAPASLFSVHNFPPTITAGTSASLVVTAQDAFGNIATGYTGSIHFTSSDSQATLPNDYTFTAADAGQHSMTATLKTAGTQSITATDTVNSGIQGKQGGVIVSPNIAVTFDLTMNPATAGKPASITVTARDAFGNRATGYLGSVHFTSTDAHGALPPDYTFTAADQGSHTFSVTLQTAGPQKVTVTDTANASMTATGPAVTVSPAATSTLVVDGFPAFVTAGSSGNLRVMAEDAFGNTTTDYTGTVHFTSTDAQAVLPADYTFTATNAGVHNFSATLATAGVQSLAATDAATTSITGAEQGIQVTNGAVTHLNVSAAGPAAAGAPFGLVVTALDAFNNVVTGYLGTVSFNSSDSTATLPGDYTFVDSDQGTHTFSVQTPTPGTATFFAVDTAASAITGNVTVPVGVSAPVTGSGVALNTTEYLTPSPVPVATFTQGTNSSPISAFGSTIDWGDGQTSQGSISLAGGAYQVAGAHMYTDEGSFAIKISISFGGTTTVLNSRATVLEQLLPDGTRGTSDQRFVSEAYRDLFNRQVDQGGLDYWTKLLGQGMSRQDVVRQIENLSEYQNLQIDSLYESMLHRHADAGGRATFVLLLNSGATYEQLAAMIAGSPEFARLQPSTTPDAIVAALYQDLLGRSTDPAAQGYVQQLKNGASTSDVAGQIMASLEYKQHLVSGYYEQLLDRTAEASAVSYYVNLMNQHSTDQDIVARIMGSAEYYNKTAI